MSKQGYVNREKRPEQFRLCELAKVYEALSDTAKPILKDAVSDIFLALIILLNRICTFKTEYPETRLLERSRHASGYSTWCTAP